MFTLKKTSHESSTSRILKHLKKSGHYGAYNRELQKVGGLSWHRRIGELRADGVNIQSVQITRGVWKYYLNDD